jgi:hypothetical protein
LKYILINKTKRGKGIINVYRSLAMGVEDHSGTVRDIVGLLAHTVILGLA